MKTVTFYALKWFQTHAVEELVPITDPRHRQHDRFMEILAAKYNPELGMYQTGVSTTVPLPMLVETGERQMGGIYQRDASYPEPGVRTRDPKLPTGKAPVLCSTGWHVPFVDTASQFHGDQLWLVKVSGTRNDPHRDGWVNQGKASFSHITLVKQLTISDVAHFFSLASSNRRDAEYELANIAVRASRRRFGGWPGKRDLLPVLWNEEAMLAAEAAARPVVAPGPTAAARAAAAQPVAASTPAKKAPQKVRPAKKGAKK